MKRRVLLLGADRSRSLGDRVENDLRSMEAYFRSDQGGAYEDEEIKVLLDPSMLTINVCLRAFQYDQPDFFLFYWSGHGGLDASRDLHMEITKDDDLKMSEIQKIGSKSMYIFDTCRNFLANEPPAAKIAVCESAAMVISRNVAREIYDEQIRKSDPHCEYFYSCTQGESAGVFATTSIYTQLLLEEARRFSSSAGVEMLAPMREITDEVRQICVAAPDIFQTPQSVTPKWGAVFPFAVKIRH